MGHTSARSAQYLPMLLSVGHVLYLFRRCALRHTSARSAQFLQMFKSIRHGLFLFRRCVFRTPPCDLHSFYNYLCVSEVRETWDFIILNKGPMTPPWRKKAQGSHAQHRVQNFSPILFPSRARGQVLGCAKNCIASKCTFSIVNVIIFKSYLDLHLSESDWCRFVVRFWLSYLN